MRIVRLSIAFGCLLLLCSCSTADRKPTVTQVDPPPSVFVPASDLPTAVAMNEDAGRGDLLIVTLRVEHGREMPFIVDTGAPITCLDKSFEPELGKRIYEGTTFDGSGWKHKLRFYAAPKIYMGNTQLMTGSNVATMDVKWIGPQIHCPIMGILGMDCLSHYCIQLDFKAKQVRFLNPNQLDVAGLGKAFPLTFSGAEPPGMGWCGYPYIKDSPLTVFRTGEGDKRQDLPSIRLIDSGDPNDGALGASLFWRKVQKQRLRPDGNTARFDKCVWDGETYTNLIVEHLIMGNGDGSIGLAFLARHLVTLNFPQRVMYLKQTSIGPLADEDKERVWRFILASVRKKGGLPGRPPAGMASLDRTTDWPEDTFECVVYPKQNPTRYHYLIAQASENEPWKFQKAWKTDAKGRTIEEYAVP